MRLLRVSLPALRSRVAAAWTHRRVIWPAATVLMVIAFIFAVVRPFQAPLPQLDERDVAESWADSVTRLGILPIYPPEEDFHVGDLWAVIANSSGTPILGEGLRLGHIDLRAHMRKPKDEPSFYETTEREKNGYRHLNPVETSDGSGEKISLTLAAFPGVTIRHSIRASAGVGGSLAGLTGNRDELDTEELRIPVAETYGAPAAAAFAEMDKYCHPPDLALTCTDEYARRAIAFAVTDRVLDTIIIDGKHEYTSYLQLRLVYRVFLAREIEHKRYRGGMRGAATGAASPSTGSTAMVPETSAEGLGGTPTARPATTPTPEGRTQFPDSEASVEFSRSDSAIVEFSQIFQRPVAFGYRAITIALTPSDPTEEKPP
jgi:hypothetical protein